jgi:hypothetical protein
MQFINLYYYQKLIELLIDNNIQDNIIEWLNSIPKLNFFYYISNRIYAKIFNNYVIIIGFEYPPKNSAIIIIFTIINKNNKIFLKLIGFGQDCINIFYNPGILKNWNSHIFRYNFYYNYFPEYNRLNNNLYFKNINNFSILSFKDKYLSLLESWRNILSKNKLKAKYILLSNILNNNLIECILKYLYPIKYISLNSIFI